mmetsp:Transcript_14736/g.26384  ORF Transcript_14736/g.26384 Transcript_14736/m.26384 type:complete len:395 (+) Transcript_14736:29-1213(+)
MLSSVMSRGSKSSVRIATYNVLSPQLCSPGWFPFCPTPDATQPQKRLERVIAKLDEEVDKNAVLCLQEVSRSWEGELHTFFNKRSYTYIHSSYGYLFNGYMGVGVAYPNKKFDLEGCNIVRISDTKKGGYKPAKSAGHESKGWGHESKGWLFKFSRPLYALLGWFKYHILKQRKPKSLWSDVERRGNTMVMLRLREHLEGASEAEQAQTFCVANYHMPCAWRTPALIGAHCAMLMQRVHKLAKGDPYVIGGDYNVKPDSPCYEILTSGKFLSAESQAEADPGTAYDGDSFTVQGDKPLTSAYKAVHGSEPDFTNYAKNKTSAEDDESFIYTLDYLLYRNGDSGGKINATDADKLPSRSDFEGIQSFPTSTEPSDHIKLVAEFEVTRPGGKKEDK